MIRPGQLACACVLSMGLLAVTAGAPPNSIEPVRNSGLNPRQPEVAPAAPPAPPEPAPPATPRQFYNAGTRKLLEGKLKEAEPLLESALAGQRDSLQPTALYNLGHVRFGQGVEELKKAPLAGAALAAGQAVSRQTDQAIGSAAEALAGDDVQSMVRAYLRGRGTRKDLKAAIAVVRRALESHGATLNKWQRAAGDFRSALELNPTETDARHNAEVVDRCIAKLVDTLRELQQLANAMADQMRDLAQKMKQLKGRIPAQNMPPGAAGDDDEEEDQQTGPQEGQKERPGREGDELTLSPEQAAWLLDGFRLDVQRRLPMGQNQQAEPRNPNRPTW
ncbi:MAG: hypothetical protein ACLQVX_11840 [Limisphaerales bacterium]